MSQMPESAPKVAPFGCTLVFAVPLAVFGLSRLPGLFGALARLDLMSAFSAGVGAFVGIGLAVLMITGHRMHREGIVRPTFPPPPIFYVMGCLVLLNFGLSVSQTGLDRLQDLRALERIAPTVVGAVLPGPVNLSGTVEATVDTSLLRSPETNTPVVYYRHVVERRSGDDWTTVSSESQSVPFYLNDGTGRVRIEPLGPVLFRVTLDHRQHRDGMRYSEFRLQPGDIVAVLGDALRHEDGNRAGQLVVTFGDDSQRPTISQGTEVRERSSIGAVSIIYSWIGLALLSVSVVFLFGAFRWHNSVAYLTAVVVMAMAALIGQSSYMLRGDLDQARTGIERHLETADREITALTATGDPEGRIGMIRIDAARAVERYNATLAEFPEGRLARWWGFEPLDPVLLGEDAAQEARTRDDAHLPTRLAGWWIWLPIFGGLIAGVGLAGRGLRAVAVKRTIENIPTARVQSVCYGLTEVKGLAEVGAHGAEAAPLSKEQACWYRYTVEEERGSGRDREWVEIYRDEAIWPFRCTDESGSIEVQPGDAEIITRHKSERQKGKKRYREHRIVPGDELYVLGFADIDAETQDRLVLRRTDDFDLPFIVSTQPESEVLYRKGALARWLLSGSLVGLILSAFFVLASMGAFAPSGYLAAVLVGWGFLFLLVGILHYNDLVFLRHRTDRNRANIDVALMKRSDLMGRLEAVVRESAKHERTLLERMAALRSTAAGESGSTPGSEPRSIHSLAAPVLALFESYPELRTTKGFASLTDALRRLEDEIALMRTGYNDAVERLNTRVRSLPDSLLARPFGFRPRPFLHLELGGPAEAKGSEMPKTL